MTTSGTTTFSMTANQIVTKAFSKIGVKIAEQDLQAHEYQDGQDALNLMVKSWGAQGLHLWAKDEGIAFLDVGKTDYLLGATGDEACQLDDFISTTTTTDQTTSDTVIPVSSSTGMVVGDYIGIELADKTRHWTTIATVDSGVQVTITTGIASASVLGSTVFTFTTLVQRPNRILSFRRKTFGDNNEVPVTSWSRNQYFNQVNKVSQGTVVNCYYSPQLTNGRLYVWQTASSVNDFVRFTFERPLEAITSGTETLDFPEEWQEAIIYNLAARLTDEYDTPPIKMQSINGKAIQFLDDLLGWDEEMESLNLQPDFG
tara:strand:- start:25 stop:969 length:945 start_codon:yes stop_codon:yes gene_type:complete